MGSWNYHRRRGVGGNGHADGQLAVLDSPLDGDSAVDRIVAGLHPTEALGGLRADQQTLEARLGRVDARYRLKHPSPHGAERIMGERVHPIILETVFRVQPSQRSQVVVVPWRMENPHEGNVSFSSSL